MFLGKRTQKLANEKYIELIESKLSFGHDWLTYPGKILFSSQAALIL